MTQTQADLKALALRHPVPSDEKLETRLKCLERMAQFYESKINDAPQAQGLMFKSFINALFYAVTIIRMYRKLTHQLAVLVEEIEK